MYESNKENWIAFACNEPVNFIEITATKTSFVSRDYYIQQPDFSPSSLKKKI